MEEDGAAVVNERRQRVEFVGGERRRRRGEPDGIGLRQVGSEVGRRRDVVDTLVVVVDELGVVLQCERLAVALVVQDGRAAAEVGVPDVVEELVAGGCPLSVRVVGAVVDEGGADADDTIPGRDQRNRLVGVVDGVPAVVPCGVLGSLGGTDGDGVVGREGATVRRDEATRVVELEFIDEREAAGVVGQPFPLDGSLECLVAVAVFGGVYAEDANFDRV
ncbi:hypothetical protein BRC85_00770 [Halobacteriales archaeon QS_1_69_70]|nr:MAG: hypothetical protein BRC85_00770 [Halobacteriales archaeon QS_1_69_70]